MNATPAKKTAAKKTAARRTIKTPLPAVDAQFLNSFTSELEQVEQSANGYGQLRSCVIVTEDNGVLVTATYEDGHWSVVLGGEE